MQTIFTGSGHRNSPYRDNIIIIISNKTIEHTYVYVILNKALFSNYMVFITEFNFVKALENNPSMESEVS